MNELKADQAAPVDARIACLLRIVGHPRRATAQRR